MPLAQCVLTDIQIQINAESIPMVKTLIPHFDEELEALRQLANAGFILGFNMTFRGPEHMHTEYPEDWRVEYESKSYYAMDPILMWALGKSGHARWSEVKLPDIRGVLARGATFGLKYGAVFSVKKKRARSFLTLARNDRELTDSEIQIVATKFDGWCDLVTNRASLTEKEIDVLALLRDGVARKDIALKLYISEPTVKQRAASATKKLQANNQIQAVAMAVSRGFI